jgi:hypothetical protein
MKRRLLRSPKVLAVVGVVLAFGVVGLYIARAAPVPGDLNGDGVVNTLDLSILLSDWGTSNPSADINHDGTVNVLDLSLLLAHWGQTGSTPTPPVSPTPAASATPTATPSPTPTATPPPSPPPTAATCPSPRPTAPVTGYSIVQCEDFSNGFGLFSPWNGGGGTTVVGAGRIPSQCSVSGGILMEKQASNGATCGGAFHTFDQQYGYWEVRMRAYFTSSSSGSAPHPVLILWPDTTVKTSEIDFFETNLGSPAGGFLHCISDPSKNCYSIPKNSVDYSQWHVYGFQWTPTSMAGYIDGTKWWSLSNISTVNPVSASHLTVQLDNLAQRQGVTPLPVQPGEMDIDWVHMYK